MIELNFDNLEPVEQVNEINPSYVTIFFFHQNKIFTGLIARKFDLVAFEAFVKLHHHHAIIYSAGAAYYYHGDKIYKVTDRFIIDARIQYRELADLLISRDSETISFLEHYCIPAKQYKQVAHFALDQHWLTCDYHELELERARLRPMANGYHPHDVMTQYSKHHQD